MKSDHLKPLIEPATPAEQAQPEQQDMPQYPQVCFQPTDNGALVQILFGPLTVFTQILPANVMDDIARRWMQHKKEMATRQSNELAVIRHINTHGRN